MSTYALYPQRRGLTARKITLAAIVAKKVEIDILLPPFRCGIGLATSQVYNKNFTLTNRYFLLQI